MCFFPTSVAHSFEHENCGDDKVLITFHDYGLLFNNTVFFLLKKKLSEI